jgi:methionine-rich copper-binding protein CopC
MKRTTGRLILALAVTLTLSAGQGMAQTQPQEQRDAPQAVSQEFDRQILEKYAAASLEVELIRNEAAQKLETIQDKNQAMEVQQEATRKTISIIEAQGLEVPTYNKIAQQINFDPELKRAIEQISNRGQ